MGGERGARAWAEEEKEEGEGKRYRRISAADGGGSGRWAQRSVRARDVSRAGLGAAGEGKGERGGGPARSCAL